MDQRVDVRALFAQQVLGQLDGLYGLALRLTRNPDDAEDLVADTVAKGWEKLDSLHEAHCLRSWLFRILANTFVSDYRRRACRPQCEHLGDEEEDEEGFSLFEQVHQPFLLWWSSPEQELLNKLLREDIERALDALSDPLREVVVLVDVEGFSYAEVSELLHIPVGTVRSRLSRGRASLQRSLWRTARENGLVRAPAGETGTRPHTWGSKT
ncbi:MAG: sigma-70 family RNA polymerase sigma factor [Rhodocyclales bacterium]|nr:sigma-70 family RNA polymerase sigma factor [Rhodocyclales bacterium]